MQFYPKNVLLEGEVNLMFSMWMGRGEILERKNIYLGL